MQFKWLLEARYPGAPQDIAHFFGIFLGVVFSGSLLVQLIVTSRVIRGVGVANTLLVLPAALLLGVFPALLLGIFWVMIVPRMVEGSVRPSLHRVSVELLYIPIEASQAITAKGTIDLVVTRLGDSFGALVLLVSSSRLRPCPKRVSAG